MTSPVLIRQVLRYLCDPMHPTTRQTEEGVAALADELQDYELTKGEVLQLINLAPWNSVGLYCVGHALSEMQRH